MARSLAIAAYVANLGSTVRIATPREQPPRPDGWVIWVRCSHPDQLATADILRRKLGEDGDPIHILTTLLDWNPVFQDAALPEPLGRPTIRTFIAHWRPSMVVWLRGDLDPILLAELDKAALATMFVDAAADGLDDVAGKWVPGAMRQILSQFEAILALDRNAADQLIAAGAPEDLVLVTGAMEEAARILPCIETERAALATAIDTRPVWLAAAVTLDECPDIATAHHHASRRAHRLLLIIAPKNPLMAETMADEFRDKGFDTILQSKMSEPPETVQVYVIDSEPELGLWYRLAPITYLGGSLRGAGCCDPFEAAALGSAVLYGPHVTPYQANAARLNAAGASMLIRTADELGPAVEGLLAADKTAELAHAAWDVTSRGAAVTSRIATYIQQRLEELGV